MDKRRSLTTGLPGFQARENPGRGLGLTAFLATSRGPVWFYQTGLTYFFSWLDSLAPIMSSLIFSNQPLPAGHRQTGHGDDCFTGERVERKEWLQWKLLRIRWSHEWVRRPGTCVIYRSQRFYPHS